MHVEPKPAYLLESVDAALQVLLMVKRLGEVRVVDVAAELGIARSTAHRLLRTLVWRDFLTQDRLGKAYRSGPVLINFAAEALDGAAIRTIARAHLELLASTVSETVHLIIREGSNVRFLDTVVASQPMRDSARTGALLPAAPLAGGKVLLAWLSESERSNLYPGRPPRLTPHSTADNEELAVQLAEVRRRGYAINMNGSLLGLSAIAVPLMGATGEVIAAIAVSVPSSRFLQNMEERFLSPLLSAAGRISSELQAAGVTGPARTLDS